MEAGSVVELVAAAGLLVLGLLVLRQNAFVAEQIAEWNKFKYDRRATLYDLDRAERLRRLYEPGPLDRLGAGALGVVLVLVAVGVATSAVLD